VKFNPLSAAHTAYDVAVNAEFSKIATAISTLGGAYVMQPVNSDIALAKVETVKFP